MVIPLRVPVELGREWKVEAAKAGKSVQKWLLGRMNFTEPVKKVMSGSARMNSEVAGKSERDKQMEEIPPAKVNPPISNVVTPSGKYGKPLEDEPIATVTCFKCKEKVVKWTMDPRGKPWCDSCIQDQKNAIA
jgi:formylmethanofuran dehydrogenase subunit E